MVIYLSHHLVASNCPPLDDPANGRVDVPGTTVGSNATYSCDTGYELDGDKVRTCQMSRTWSGSAPVCRCEFNVILALCCLQ